VTTSTAPVNASAGPEPRHRPRRGLVLVLVAAALVVVGLTTVAEPVRVASGSMSPTYDAGDEVLVEKVTQRSDHPHRGDVVVFEAPGSGELMIKRVAALPDDSVGLEDGVLVVNGEKVPEAYVDQATVDGTYFGPVRVPAGHVFVLGDDRANSVDSRTFGALPSSALVGRVVLRLWPR
jgi:signal peptidase I